MDYTGIVRYGAMGHVGPFKAEFAGLRMGDKCVVRTDRGVELGNLLAPLRPRGEDARDSDLRGEILRRVNSDDLDKLKNIEDELEPQEFDFCKKKIQERGLPMKLASVEHLFGGTKVIFYFLADGRVDFRDLVKDLAQEYRMRIEMRQIGVRDEARLLADYEHCGRELCCKTFIKNLEPVSMKMAKNQKATLDPSKISGRCGRLMCCLRFEDKVYEELKRNLPRKGSRVETPDGQGDVIGQDILRQEVRVDMEGGGDGVYSIADVKVLRKPSSGKKEEKKDGNAGQKQGKPSDE